MTAKREHITHKMCCNIYGPKYLLATETNNNNNNVFFCAISPSEHKAHYMKQNKFKLFFFLNLTLCNCDRPLVLQYTRETSFSFKDRPISVLYSTRLIFGVKQYL